MMCCVCIYYVDVYFLVVQSYSGSADRDAGLFIMEYELEGDPARLKNMCDDIR